MGVLTTAPSTRWKSAGDAIVAAQRFRNDQTGLKIYKPEEGEKRVAIVDKKSEIAMLEKNRIVATQQRQVTKAAQQSLTAAQVGDPATLALIIQKQPEIAKWEDENKVTALLMASAYGRLACTEVLCGAGADVNKLNVWGSTPLINAAHNAHAAVVHFLILNDASVGIRDKDGTALDGALKRLVRMVREVAKATDDKHPDKPALEASSAALTSLSGQTNRGPIWHKQLEAAFVPFRALIAQAEGAATMLQLGKVAPAGAGPAALKTDESERPGSAASKGSKGSKASKKDDDDEAEGPDEGRAALYAGLASYTRCIEMLRDPGLVKKDEKLRIGGPVSDTAKSVDGLTQRAGRVRKALALDVSIALPEIIRQANVAMGLEERGSLPEQTERLVVALGLQ